MRTFAPGIGNGREDTKIQRYKDMERRKKPSAGRLSDRTELSDMETYEALQELKSPLWREAWEDVGKFE